MQHKTFWGYASAPGRGLEYGMQVQHMIFLCSVWYFEGVQVHQSLCRCTRWRYRVCLCSILYLGGAYDILRVCRCTREYAGAPDGGAAVGDKFGAEARRPPPAACCCSQPHNPPFLHHQHFSYSTRSRMPEKKLNGNSFLIQKLRLLYFRSNMLENLWVCAT